jgi:glycerol-3-phosphate dehydrogenase (NAD+)
MAKLVAETVKENPALYEETIRMWVYEEEVTIPKDSRHYKGNDKPEKLSEIINTHHENVKYLPNITLPSNVVAVTDLPESCKDSTFHISSLPEHANNSKERYSHLREQYAAPRVWTSARRVSGSCPRLLA